MENAPLVSVITIVYNGERYIEDSIRSVINQSYKNIEYIIIDGGSSDNTVSLIKKYEKQIAFWISEKDKGISDAFNKGIARATGKIIGLLNSDDWYEKDTIAKAIASIEDYDAVYGDLQLWKANEKDFMVKGDHRLLTREMTINHPTVFVRREYYTRFGSFDTQYKAAMDYELVLRFMVNKCKFKYIPEVLANMRWQGNSDKNWLKGCKETLQIKNKYLPHKKLQNSLFFIKHVVGISIPKYLEKIHFHFLVRAYRAKFSAQKKIYN